MRELEYPFKPEQIIRKKKSLRRRLLEDGGKSFIDKKIAILGGQTTEDIRACLELFLLNYGIRPVFYESGYNRYYEDGMFPNPELEEFAPDIIYICTCIHSIARFPSLNDDRDSVDSLLNGTYQRYVLLWDRIRDTYSCPVIQNNFEYPYFRLLGNRDAADIHGRVNFVTRLNLLFAEYAYGHEDFHICDVNYISASYGLEAWSDPYYWHMYKYSAAVPAIPYLSFNAANIIKSIFGRNKKVLNLDLDNTLWGGTVGDDGADRIEIGQETPLAQTYSEFQKYIKLHKDLGILLTVNSKNDLENALAGLSRPDSILRPDDFISIKANWEPKSKNLMDTAAELSLLPESFVLVDDNPAERAIITELVPGAAAPEIDEPEHYIKILDRSGFFEATSLSGDDLNRSAMYADNAKRQEFKSGFSDYADYLRSLDMHAEIKTFIPAYMSRIAQLTNKSNQFNLTTKRYSLNDIEAAASDPACITLYGKLSDRFGDNGVVSAVIGRRGELSCGELHIELWIMSCRVLKRQMEYAMMDELIKHAYSAGVEKIYGYYYPTAKNSMVKNFYGDMGFSRVQEDGSGNTVWEYIVPHSHKAGQSVISVNVS